MQVWPLARIQALVLAEMQVPVLAKIQAPMLAKTQKMEVLALDSLPELKPEESRM